jgi:hypothetical protein
MITQICSRYEIEKYFFSSIQNSLSKSLAAYKASDSDVDKSITDGIATILNNASSLVEQSSKDPDCPTLQDNVLSSLAIVQQNGISHLDLAMGRPLSTKYTGYLANIGGNWLIADGDKISKLFGNQFGRKPGEVYGNIDGGQGCDDYARGALIYALTGEVVSHADLGCHAYTSSGTYISMDSIRAKNRQNQAEIAYDFVHQGMPCVIHVNSSSGNGHWMTVIGYADKTNKNNVTIDKLVVYDSASGRTDTIGNLCNDYDQIYDTDGYGMTGSEPGYQVKIFKKK